MNLFSFWRYRALYATLIIGCALPQVGSLQSPSEQCLFIHIWYGDHQIFGKVGHPQRWINILGHVAPASYIDSLFYSLNGSSPSQLSFLEDKKRLAKDGDFNIDIDRALLKPGINKVQIIAKDLQGRFVRRLVTVKYICRDVCWPLPYRIDWTKIDRIQDVVQIVDGKWTLTDDGIRTVERYYDRIVAFGDHSWRDYEIATRVIFHAFTSPRSDSNNTGVTHAAIASRWPGHDYDEYQPHVKWHPLGATSEFRIGNDLQQCRWRIFDGKTEFYVESNKRRTIELNRKYNMKHRVETLSNGQTLYKVKFWQVGDDEPSEWDLERYETGDLLSGSALLIAHHADVTFGDIMVVPLHKALQ